VSRSKRAQTERKQTERSERARIARRTRTVRTVGLSAVGVTLLVAAFFAFGGTGPELSGDTGPNTWDLPGLEDPQDRVALADFAGTPTVAVFFASWCDVCEREMAGFVAVADQLGDQVNWVGINSQDNGRGGGDAASLSTSTFGMRGMPLTVVYDEAGSIVHVQRGGISGEQLLALLTEAFGLA
jgi:thiol-disulfide isomerase/thioredoxin